MSYKNIYFILVRPQLGENIGATARACLLYTSDAADE